ncbi:hypothetical protein AVEN_222554-1 [Araneus ventricosus]|uniref:Uncharacterized protein n=1 Tax=Araneus ventricosus TaxID=182803 RepID=A0A4Y2GXT8_ARAVE|nr:hypothetical protein AVEN_222554-1 [Araneus ventricosus]
MESDKTGLWENKQQKELLDGNSVGTPRADIAKLKVPSWYDEKKFNRAKELFRDNFTAQRLQSGEVSGLEPDGSTFETRFHCRSVVYWACCTLNHTQGAKRLALGVVRKFGCGMTDQVSTSSFSRGSKLRARPKVALVLLQNGTSK